MARWLCNCFFSAVLSLGLLNGVLAQQLPNPHIKINRATTHIVFESPDRVTKRYELVLEALTPEGAQHLTKAQLGFNSALDDLQILQAKTIKADGREIVVQPEGLVVQKGLSAPGVGVTVPEWEIREINFPDVKAGDKVYRHWTTTSKQSPLPGFQTHQDFLLPQIEVDEFHVRIEAPKNMVLAVAAKPAPQKTIEGDRQIWEVRASNTASTVDDNLSSIHLRIPHVMVSTLASNEEFAIRFAASMMEKAVVTPEIESLAKRITAKATTDEQKAQAIYDWVRKEIKYVALFLGVDGWVPHDTAHILSKRYGDCKDHVSLMHALLAAVGVPSRPALVNTFAHYDMDPVAVGFNHVITYLPSLNRFVDPTDMNAPFEALPHAIYGKPVVVSDGKVAETMRVPALRKADNTVLSQTHMTVAADGSADISLKVQTKGHAAYLMKDQLSQIPAGMGASAIQRILKNAGYQGTGFLRNPRVSRDTTTESFEADMSVRDFLKNVDAGAVVPNPPFNLQIDVLSNLGNHQQETRTMPYVCNSMHIREEFSMAFDAGFKLVRVPASFSKEIDGIRFQSVIEASGNRVHGFREIEIEHGEQECSPEEYSRRRPVMLDIVRHLRSQIIYERL